MSAVPPAAPRNAAPPDAAPPNAAPPNAAPTDALPRFRTKQEAIDWSQDGEGYHWAMSPQEQAAFNRALLAELAKIGKTR